MVHGEECEERARGVALKRSRHKGRGNVFAHVCTHVCMPAQPKKLGNLTEDSLEDSLTGVCSEDLAGSALTERAEPSDHITHGVDGEVSDHQMLRHPDLARGQETLLRLGHHATRAARALCLHRKAHCEVTAALYIDASTCRHAHTHDRGGAVQASIAFHDFMMVYHDACTTCVRR